MGGVFGANLYEDRQIQVNDIDLESLSKPSLEPYINYNTDTKELTIIKMPTSSKREAFIKNIQKIVPDNKKDEVEKIVRDLEKLNNDKLDSITDIVLLRLLINEDGEDIEFEESLILEYIDITDKELIQNSTLTLDEFNVNVHEHIGQIDITKNNKLSIKEVTTQNSLFDEQENNYVSDVINEYGIKNEMYVASAHRNPEKVREIANHIEECCDVVIAGAGMAAHLPGVMASMVTKPVIGVPIDASPLHGMDALLAIVQMPPGIPVATVAVNGAKNAAILAMQIMALKDDEIKRKYSELRKAVCA